jgi:PAS domain S-box-containing protein
MAPTRRNSQHGNNLAYLAFRTVHRRRDGSTYPVDVHLEASILGETAVFVAIIGDITEQRKKDEELRES